jgi:hypothetical protein
MACSGVGCTFTFYCICLKKINICSAEEIQIFVFKVFIFPPIRLCWPGLLHHSPHPSYARDYVPVVWEGSMDEGSCFFVIGTRKYFYNGENNVHARGNENLSLIF